MWVQNRMWAEEQKLNRSGLIIISSSIPSDSHDSTYVCCRNILFGAHTTIIKNDMQGHAGSKTELGLGGYKNIKLIRKCVYIDSQRYTVSVWHSVSVHKHSYTLLELFDLEVLCNLRHSYTLYLKSFHPPTLSPLPHRPHSELLE